MPVTLSNWQELIFRTGSPAAVWIEILKSSAEWASRLTTNQLEAAALDADHLLADTAWELWSAYADDPACRTLRTSERLIQWWNQPGGIEPAVLILDALSLRELPLLLREAKKRGLTPHTMTATGAEVPTDTNAFARALGVPARASLKHGSAPSGFRLAGAHTEVFEHIPFEDCQGAIQNQPRVFVWHDLIDANLSDAPNQSRLDAIVHPRLSGDGFWKFVDHLRQGRRLVITGDHGYATKSNARPVDDEAVGKTLREVFGGQRLAPSSASFATLIPPWVVQTHGNHHVVIGNRNWRVPGPGREAYHGGLSLLEVGVPWLEFAART